MIAITAGAGYGKTTLLKAFARRDHRPIAWLSLDAQDEDPAVLLADLALAFDRIHPIERALLQRLTNSGSPGLTARMRALTRLVDAFGEPVVVVLDDVQVLRSYEVLDMISTMIEHIPVGSTAALASRATPDLHLPRLRAAGRLFELGARDLAMDPAETAAMVQAVHLDLPEDVVSLIGRRTEGWPVAVYLATLSIRNQSDPIAAAARFSGDDRLIAHYVDDELLSGLPKRALRFLTRTSILDQLTPSLCDAVVGMRGSATLLAELARTNAFVVPVVDHPDRYRYHQLLRDVLLAHLRRTEPDRVPDLYRRAAEWSEANGMTDDAVGYAQGGGHANEAARLVCSVARRYLSTGRFHTLRMWLAWFDDATLRAYPPLAVATAWYHAITGDQEPVYWLRMAEAASFDDSMPDGTVSFPSAVALLRAALCLDGPRRMDADVDLSADLGIRSSDWRVMHHLLAGEAALLLGDTERARAIFREAAEFAGPDQPGAHVMVLSELAALAADAHDWDEASRRISQARSIAASRGFGDMIVQPLMFAVSAIVLARQGQADLARQALIEAQKLRATSSTAFPWVSIRSRLAMARAYLALSDVEGARTVLAEARDIQARRQDIGTLADHLDELQGEIRTMRAVGRLGPTSLSAAELRVLTLLPTRLSFWQIGERLFVSNNTVKSHAMSIYRKLGVSSRSEAVDRAAELGLLDL